MKMRGINIDICCKRFSFLIDDVRVFLENIVKNKIRFKEDVKKILLEINQQKCSSRCIDVLRKVYFLYNEEIREKMVSEENWYVIGSNSEAESKKDEYKKEAERYSSRRYEKDYGWLGVYAEKKVKSFFYDYLKLNIEEWGSNLYNDGKGWQDKIDRYDLKVKNKTIDVKCATQPHYIEITPKVIVENEVRKDIYIATKFFDDGKLYLIGFFSHEDIIKYPKTKLYGTEYYKVPIYEAKCVRDLLNILK